MDSPSLANEGAALAVSPTTIEREGDAPRPKPDATPHGGVVNHAEVLAELLDFPGGIKLSELFGPDPPANDPDPMAPLFAERLVADVRARLDSLEHAVLKPLTGRRAPTPPPAEELWELLQGSGALPLRDEAGANRLAQALGEPYRKAFAAALRQAQAQVATLRWEIQHDIRALGPRAAQLERFDAALNNGVKAQVGALYDRMEAALERTFKQACARALRELPETASCEHVRGWRGADGWLERYRDRCVQVARAAFGHGRRNLEGLLLAVELSTAPEDETSPDEPGNEEECK